MRTEFLCISVLRVASGRRVKLTSCKSALNSALLEKYSVSLKTLLQEDISEPEFYGFKYWFTFILPYSRISHEYSFLFIIVINLIFMFSL